VASTTAFEQLRTTHAHATQPRNAHAEPALVHADPVQAALACLAAHCRKMPPVAALGVRPLGYDGRVLRLGAPLAANVNDKGCAFGGSLSGLMTLAGWGWVTLRLQLQGLEAEVYVADSQVKYIAPLYDDLVAEATPAAGESWETFLETLDRYGKARIAMQARIPMNAGGEAAVLNGRFVALRPMR
jgi:thioesterase domain-containing protein